MTVTCGAFQTFAVLYCKINFQLYFSGHLIASFTVQKYHKPFDTLAEVAADTQYQLIVEPSNVIYTVLQVN